MVLTWSTSKIFLFFGLSDRLCEIFSEAIVSYWGSISSGEKSLSETISHNILLFRLWLLCYFAYNVKLVHLLLDYLHTCVYDSSSSSLMHSRGIQQQGGDITFSELESNLCSWLFDISS